MSDTTPCPCEVCVPYPACMDCCAGWDDLDPALQCRATVLAWSTLRLLTAGRVGNCEVELRPCLATPCDVCQMGPRNIGGDWFNIVCGHDPCSCTRLCEIVLPGPVALVTEVMLDGELIAPDLFRVDNGNILVREDGECWPSCQDLSLPVGAPGTLGISYVPGLVPGPAGEWAAGLLACEYAKACTGAKCRLPSAVTAISRNGVAMEVTSGLFPGGITGIREVDAYVASINPHGLRTAPMVWSPDMPRHRWSSLAAPEPVVIP